MRILPILWAEPPTAADWERLSEARKALGYMELIQPVEALEGSPQPVLCIGKLPSWMTDFAYVESTELTEELQKMLDYCLSPGYDQQAVRFAELLSVWMDTDVKYAGEEEQDGGVRFV